MKLQDLQLNRYRFCARKTLYNEIDFTKVFEDLLKNAVEKIGGFKNTLQNSNELNELKEKSIKYDTSKSSYFDPIISSKEDSEDSNSAIVFHNEFYRTLISGIFLDVYVLQEWIGLKKRFTNITQLLAAKEKLQPEIREYIKIESELHAECFCYFTEFLDSDSETKEIFTKLLKTENFSAVELDYAHFAICFDGEKAEAVVISRSFVEVEAITKATKLSDDLLREYFLSFAKVTFEIDKIQSLDVTLDRQDLLNYLKRDEYWSEENQPLSLNKIERANRKLTKYRVNLSEKIKTIEAHLHTIEINIRNAEKILDNPILRQKKADLRRIMIEPLELQVEQIKVDLTYHNIYEEKAKIISEEIANLANLQAGIYGRKLSWLFGLLTLIGALQLFPEFQLWEDLWAKIAILATIIIFTLIFILFGRDIKNKFFPSSNE